MRDDLSLDVFFANDLFEPVRVGTASDVESARVFMEQIAKERPGWYFVWDAKNLRVLARIDTTRRSEIRPEAGCHVA